MIQRQLWIRAGLGASALTLLLAASVACRGPVNFADVPAVEDIAPSLVDGGAVVDGGTAGGGGAGGEALSWAAREQRSNGMDNDVLREGHVGYVLHVIDGDTLDLQVRDRYLKIRMQGASAPECEKEPVPVGRQTRLQCSADDEFYGLESMKALAALVDGQRLIVECEGVGAGVPCATDPYGRALANLRLEDGRSLGAALIAAGAGWASTSFASSTRAEFCAKEYEAREARRGMWAAGSVSDVIARMNAGTQRWYRAHDARCDEALKGL